jgi:hypothetical protein
MGATRVTAILGRKDHVESLFAILDRHRTVTSKTPDSFRFIVASSPAEVTEGRTFFPPQDAARI